MHKKIVQVVKEKLKERNDNDFFLIGIDGNCGSGKTMLAEKLSKELNCDVIHMDDFFLPQELRTPERLSESAGNIHYERFIEEVMQGIKTGEFSYRKFDCKSMDYTEEIQIKPNNVLIIEGSYSFSHEFIKEYDYKILLKCSRNIQIDRLRKRVGEERLIQFISKWIPMENRYFENEDLKNKVDIIINTNEDF